jgi:HPr kinase/phosphorylase
MGQSGIGKSETALELVERGHRLVADDAVHVRCVEGSDLYGQASELLQYHMEIRGLGIINVKDLFGVGAIRGRKRIELVIELEEWNAEKEYERLGLDDELVEILGVPVPRITMA